VREIPNGPRTLDLDIVLYGGAVIAQPGLTVPHPRAHERAFVLEPLLEVWPDAEIPGHGPASALLAAVAPAQAGAQSDRGASGPRLRGDDGAR
jgi:2-amino-4-hydroxy-6-hydroxymethyldihydropteridine diphosphokinase